MLHLDSERLLVKEVSFKNFHKISLKPTMSDHNLHWAFHIVVTVYKGPTTRGKLHLHLFQVS